MRREDGGGGGEVGGDKEGGGGEEDVVVVELPTVFEKGVTLDVTTTALDEACSIDVTVPVCSRKRNDYPLLLLNSF